MSKEFLKSILPEIPELPGIYRMIDQNDVVIYIGKAKNLASRLGQYIQKLTRKNEIMMNLAHKVEYTVTSSEAEALMLEAKMIKKLKPKFNILLKDDKSFPYIKLRLDTDFPQILKHRSKDYQLKKISNAKFFGPFASNQHTYKTIEELQKIFKLRSCSDAYFANRTRPCLQYEIKKCYAPCVGKISKAEYAEITDQVIEFFQGKNNNLQKLLSQKMHDLSEQMRYEEAAELRDKIRSLSYIQMKSGTANYNFGNLDVVAAAEKNGKFCIELFIYRSGQPCGNAPYFPSHTEEASKSEVLESFITQFYQDKALPDRILISDEIPNTELLIKSLELFRQSETIKIVTAKSSFELELINNAIQNAELELERHIKTSAKNLAMLKLVAEILGLQTVPTRIEIYDNSHLQGTNAYGAMVVAGTEGFDKKEYRLFSVGNSNQTNPSFGGDDYAMLREVMRRRLAKLKTDPAERKPDLMIIDGGKGHLSTCFEIFKEFGYDASFLPFVCMSKGVDRNSGREQFHMVGKETFTLDKNLPVMKYLQILRDEAHNFAITSHRKKRSAAIRSSILDEIPDIGPKRKKLLLNYFGGGQNIADATIKELSKIEGISTGLATKIYNYFHKSSARQKS